MQTEESANNAIKALNNSVFNGSNIVVEKGRMKERNLGGGPGPNRPGGNNGPRGQSGGFRGINKHIGPINGNRRNDKMGKGILIDRMWATTLPFIITERTENILIEMV